MLKKDHAIITKFCLEELNFPHETIQEALASTDWSEEFIKVKFYNVKLVHGIGDYTITFFRLDGIGLSYSEGGMSSYVIAD